MPGENDFLPNYPLPDETTVPAADRRHERAAAPPGGKMERPFPVSVIHFFIRLVKAGGMAAFPRYLLLSFCCLALLPGDAAAYRPFITPDAGLEKAGYWGMALGVNEVVRSGEENEFAAPAVILSRGMAERWEAGIGSALRLYKDKNVQMGFGNTFCYVKNLLRKGFAQGTQGVYGRAR
ncbi:MAG: hypothetical protein ACYC5N_11585 [Endomicrobiales bacterium]